MNRNTCFNRATTANVGKYFDCSTAATAVVTLTRYYHACGLRVGVRVGCGPIQVLFGDHLGRMVLMADANFANSYTIRYCAWGTLHYLSETPGGVRDFIIYRIAPGEH